MSAITRRPVNEDKRARTYNAQIIAGKVRSAVRQVTDCLRGGLLDPFGPDPHSDQSVYQVLQSKHPDLHVPDLTDSNVICFEDYDRTPGTVPVHANNAIVTKVEKRLHGGAGPGGVYSFMLRDMLL